MYGAGENRIEYRLYVRLRAADDTQDLAGRGLRVERRPQLTVARLQLREQAHVLDGDHGLVGERLQQLDLLLRKWFDDSSCDRDRPDGSALTKHRHGQDGTEHTEGVDDVWIVVVIRDLHDRCRKDASRRRTRAARSLRESLADGFDFFGRTAVLGGEVDQLTVEPMNSRQIRAAEQRRRLRDCIEDRLDIRRRARDDAEDITGCRLPGQRAG